MIYSQHALNVLAIKTFKGIGAATIINNIAYIQNINNITKVLSKYNISMKEFEDRKLKILQDLTALENSMDGFIAIGDEEFPSCRGKVPPSQQPVVLFYKGDISLLKTHCVAVIGVLEPDAMVERRERRVVSELIKNEITVISGLAQGCDTIAHEQTLKMNGKTIAILPSSLNNILPAVNRGLALNILNKGGLLLSEYAKEPTSRSALIGRYQERDRLQALFSDVIILAASYAKNDLGKDSGSRLAMGYAKDYSIQRAVIYDDEDVDNPIYNLNREIIRENSFPEVIIISKDKYDESLRKIIKKRTLINAVSGSKKEQLMLF